MKQYIIQEKSKDMFHAGTKAMRDCETILQEKKNFQPFTFCSYKNKTGFINRFKKEFQFLQFVKLEKNSVFVMQHPLYIGTHYLKILKVVKKIKKIKVFFLIHDLESLRNMLPAYHNLFQQLDQLMYETGDVFITHNEKMSAYLIKQGIPAGKIVVLGLFDYLTAPEKHIGNRSAEKGIVIAGNLAPEKSGYLYQLTEEYCSRQLVLYGTNFSQNKMSTVNYCFQGVFPPDDLPYELNGSYGLVWDGDEIQTCAGNMGNYLRYNNPHKVSLYIAAELPVIIWRHAALADFVRAHHIGILIDSLEEIDDKLSKIETAEYERMRDHMKKLADKVRSGGYLLEAYEKALNILEVDGKRADARNTS